MSTRHPGKNPRKLMVTSLMDSACSLMIRMVNGSLNGIKISLCFWGIRASPAQSDFTRFALARSAAHEPPRFSNKQLGHASEDSDVNSIGGGEKPSLHAMGWAISLVGGASPTCEAGQI